MVVDDSCLSPSPLVLVVTVFTGKPSVTSPTTRVSVRSWHASLEAADGSGVAGAVRPQPAAVLGRSTYQASISVRIGVLSHTSPVVWRVTVVLMRRASRPNMVWRSSVSVSVVVMVTRPALADAPTPPTSPRAPGIAWPWGRAPGGSAMPMAAAIAAMSGTAGAVTSGAGVASGCTR